MRLDRRILQLERRRQREMTNERKRDAREKIALGGLVVKAGLREADRAFLLGVLVEAAGIGPETATHRRLAAVGREAFQSETPVGEEIGEGRSSGRQVP